MTFILMIAPALILFIAFNTIPLITGAFYSFTNYKGYGSFEFVGLRNYIDLFSDARVGNSYLFTFKYAIVGTVLVNVISLLLALGLNSKIKFKSALRGVYFLPNVLGGLVVGYIQLYLHLYYPCYRLSAAHKLHRKQYSCRRGNRLDRRTYRRRMAGGGDEHNHLHFGTSDHSG